MYHYILFQGRAFFFSILFIYSFRKALCFFRLPHLEDACMVLSLCSPPNLLFSSWSDPRQPCFGGPCKGALNLVLWENDRIGKKKPLFLTHLLSCSLVWSYYSSPQSILSFTVHFLTVTLPQKHDVILVEFSPWSFFLAQPLLILLHELAGVWTYLWLEREAVPCQKNEQGDKS